MFVGTCCFIAHFYLFFVMTLVMACRIRVPDFSTSFLDNPFVKQTLSAGLCVYTSDLAPEAAADSALARVTRTP